MKQRMPLEILNAAAPRERLRVVNADDVATVYVYDYIGGWDGVQAGDFVKGLNAITASQINLRINSPGGSVFDGRAMAAAVQQHVSRVTAYVDGIAASAASWLAIAADEVVMADGSFLMIHNSHAIGMGDKRVMLELAGTLEQLDNSFVSDYVAKTGKEAAQIRDWMDAETWFSAEQAVEHGFSDRVEKGKKAVNCWNLSLYNNAPEELLRPAKLDDTHSPEPEPKDMNEQRAANERLAVVLRIAA